MDLSVQLGHYIKVESDNEELVNELYENYEDKFFIPKDGIILSNKIGSGTLFKGGDFCEDVVKEISLEDISNSYMEFNNVMGDILFMLDDNGYKYQVKFGIITYHN